MRIRSICAVILLVWIKFMVLKVSAEYCFDPNILDPRGGKVVNCALVTDIKSLLKNQQYIKSPAILSFKQNVNMFETTLHCSSTEEICSKVKATFDSAGEILSSTINFVEKIKVNATFTPFCEKGYCEDEEILGSAGPIRFHPMIDDDDMVRLYPQSLVKQFQYHTHLEYSQYDIGAIFNSDAKYWFGGEINIEKNQFDFLYIILHELIHGLGFGSSWDQYYNKTKISSITQELNEFFDQKSLNNIKINNQRDFEINFHKSKQFNIAKQMFETSFNPFRVASSISHIDNSLYSNTEDFLMRPVIMNGVTLQQEIINGGNYSGGPIGPKLKQILETLGYSTKDNPASYRPRVVNPASVDISIAAPLLMDN
ncbi:11222_t:CDS:2 [Rhizophagus irregularis]|nr:11222_t:CDS:2 [Rhizophagus irregularis]